MNNRERLSVDVPSRVLSTNSKTGTQRWNRDDKTAAVQHYILWGDTNRLSRDLGIPRLTVENWIEQSDWWGDLLEACKLEKQAELDARFTKIIHEALDSIDDRIKHGDYKLVHSTKELVRVPVASKDLSSIANTIFDKRQLLRGDATVIANRKIDNTKELEAKFLQIAQELQGKNVVATHEKLEQDNG